MVIIGSSSISPLPGLGPTGPIGPTGPTGNAPLYGGSAGATGFTGATGTYVVSGYRDEDYLYLVLSDGRTLQFSDLKGPAGYTGGKADGITLGSGEPIFRDISEGMTFNFKGISASGNVSAIVNRRNNIEFAASGPPEMLQLAQTGDQNNLHNFSFAYLKEANVVEGAGITFDNNGTMVFGTGPSGIYQDTITLDVEDVIVQVPPVDRNEIVTIYGHECIGDCGQTAGAGVGIQLAVTAGSVYEVRTPIGIGGFTGHFQEDEVFNFSMILHGNNVWKLPDNLLYSTSNSSFSCGTDVINFVTKDAGMNWYAIIASSGYGVGVDDCGDGGPIAFGSCCYEDDEGKSSCIEYTTKEECDELYNSVFHLLSDCSNCEQNFGGVCCSRGNDNDPVGTCISGVSKEECDYFNGAYYTKYNFIEKDPVNGIYQMVPLDDSLTIKCGGHLPCYDVVEDMEEPPGITWDCIENSGNLLGYNSIPNNLCVGCDCDTIVKIACCKNGSCIGDSSGRGDYEPMSAVVCRYIYGGVPVIGQCGDEGLDCCDAVVYEGACCIKDHPLLGETCIQTTHENCLNGFTDMDGSNVISIPSGIFMGPGVLCDDIDCCFGGDNPPGSSCEDDNDCETLCCVGGECRPSSECISCINNSDCPGDCNKCINGICEDNDCSGNPDGECCNSETGECEPCDPVGCENNSDCPGDCNKCINGICEDNNCSGNPNGECCNSETGDCEPCDTSCTSDDDCPLCSCCDTNTGVCSHVSCDNEWECSEDSDCDSSQFCIDCKCKDGPDSGGDGSCCLIEESVEGCCCLAEEQMTGGGWMKGRYDGVTRQECISSPWYQGWEEATCDSIESTWCGEGDWNCLVSGDGCDSEDPCKRMICCCDGGGSGTPTCNCECRHACSSWGVECETDGLDCGYWCCAPVGRYGGNMSCHIKWGWKSMESREACNDCGNPTGYDGWRRDCKKCVIGLRPQGGCPPDDHGDPQHWCCEWSKTWRYDPGTGVWGWGEAHCEKFAVGCDGPPCRGGPGGWSMPGNGWAPGEAEYTAYSSIGCGSEPCQYGPAGGCDCCAETYKP